METEQIRSKTGRTLSELTLERVLGGELTAEDFSIGGDTLQRQAEAVEAAGFCQYAQNLRRASELTRLSNEEVLEIYRALRPGRASLAELLAFAKHLEDDLAAPLIAILIREAAEVYRLRGLVH
jgi:propanediol dehydratase small subunit